ncbi:MAG TPA: PqiC family protein [Geminicoccaceae bacterium]|nr:PqiC family protein [Geminicoccaceae bacterium]
MPMPRLLAAALLLVLAACNSSPPTQFYTLSGMQLPPGNPGANRTIVGIGPVTLPDYLDRPQIVTRASGNRVTLASFQSWIEPVDSMFTRVLVGNLSSLLATDNVITLPQRRPLALDYQVEVDVDRFDGDLTGRAVLDARWRVFGKDGEQLIGQGRSTIVQPAAEPDSYEALVAAMSQALAQMSRAIANTIEQHRSG